MLSSDEAPAWKNVPVRRWAVSSTSVGFLRISYDNLNNYRKAGPLMGDWRDSTCNKSRSVVFLASVDSRQAFFLEIFHDNLEDQRKVKYCISFRVRRRARFEESSWRSRRFIVMLI